MRKSVLGLCLFFLTCGIAQAKMSVSPVIIEAVQVQAGDSFEIVCQHWGDDILEIQLSLALFDQNEGGSVVFLEEPWAVQSASDVLSLDKKHFALQPKGQETVRIQVNRDDFDHLYAVLFVKPNQPGVHTRFAVLFLLSTSGRQPDMAVSFWEQKEQALAMTVQNDGLRHGLWEGELLCFDAADELAERLVVQSGVVLAGRSRGVEITLPSWVKRVEILAAPSGRRR